MLALIVSNQKVGKGLVKYSSPLLNISSALRTPPRNTTSLGFPKADAQHLKGNRLADRIQMSPTSLLVSHLNISYVITSLILYTFWDIISIGQLVSFRY